MSWLYSCYYMSVQGRVGGLEDMRWRNRFGLMSAHGHELSDNFKTAYFHAHQAVSSSEMSSKGTRLYVTVARPAVVGDNNDALYDDEAKLFLTNTAKPEYRMGKLVTSYFEMKTKDTPDQTLHITTNGIRSMYETTASDLHDKGLISLEQKAAVTRLGGHNGATVEKFYLKKKLAEAVSSARQVLSIEYARSPHEIDSTHSCDTTAHPVTDSALSTTPTTPVPTAFSQHGADLINFTDSIFEDIQLYDFSEDALEEDNNIDMEWYDDEQSSSSSSSSSSSFSSSSAAAATTVLENPQRWLNGISSSSAAAGNSLILDNPKPSNTMGAPPLPLVGCGIGQSHRPKRVLWTEAEINKTRELYKLLIRQLPSELKRRIASYIWDYIVNKMDPVEVAEIYHPCHITDSQKIRHCIRLYITPFL